mmetsp:Transcript_33317/g.71994  ORF Transcript_33317/g.71994 Transcript_33317/m.71994 type:complete len:376 (-) Transcript_33317:774-1901(-)
MECDEDGRIKDPAYFQQRISNGPPNAATQSASSATSYNARNTNNSNSYNNNDAIIRPTKRIHNNKKRNRQGNTTNCTSPSSISIIPTLPALPNLPTNLFDLEHCQHHIRIYNYFSSLHSNLLELLFYQTKKIRKHVIRKAGVSVTAIRDLLTDLERAFGNVREFNKTKNKMRVDEIELAMKGGDEDEEGLEDDGDDADAKNDDENNSANNSIIHNEETVKSEDEKKEDAPPPSSSSRQSSPLQSRASSCLLRMSSVGGEDNNNEDDDDDEITHLQKIRQHQKQMIHQEIDPLERVNHNKIKYENFRRAFYTAPNTDMGRMWRKEHEVVCTPPFDPILGFGDLVDDGGGVMVMGGRERAMSFFRRSLCVRLLVRGV